MPADGDDPNSLRTIPLFPLATPALFPAVRVPLFIFEPRYRQMTEAALAGERVIGMCTVVPTGRPGMQGDPQLHPIGCLGLIDAAKQRPDGTWDIAVEGISRFEIQSELDKPEGRLFREAHVRVLEEEVASADIVAQLRTRVHDRYRELLGLLAPQAVEEFEAQDFDSIPDDVYANTVSLSLDVDPIEKQSLLESAGVPSRLERVLTVLEFKIAETSTPNSPGSGTLQ